MADVVRGPVLIELCLLLRQFFGDAVSGGELDAMTDEDLYRHIVFAASLRHSRAEFTARQAPELDDVVACVLQRLGGSALGAAGPRSPQARHGGDVPVRVRNGPWTAPDDKPEGALWTSSFLPDGTSMWRWGESAEFGTGRVLGAVAFDAGPVRVFTIDSAADYGTLAQRYPRAVAGRARVSWSGVAEDFDAVRLSVLGVVTAQYVPVRGAAGTAVLSGWDAESTAWLRSPTRGGPPNRASPRNLVAGQGRE